MPNKPDSSLDWERILQRKGMLTPMETTLSGKFDLPVPPPTLSFQRCPICGHMCTGLTFEELPRALRSLIGGDDAPSRDE